MASFYTTVSRIGQLAGGLDVAQKTKEKEKRIVEVLYLNQLELLMVKVVMLVLKTWKNNV